MSAIKPITVPDKNEELAEFIGIMLGDGYLHITENRVVITGSLEDQYYYKFYVVPLINNLFNKKPKLSFRKGKKACDLVLEDKSIFDILVGKIGLVRGNKINAVIPNSILKEIKLMKLFLRGLFDTDGSLKFSKQGKKLNYYPRIRISLKESKISRSVEFILNSLKFAYSKSEDKRCKPFILCYEISGTKMLTKWVNEIKFRNPIHISKYLFWKKFGFYKPRSTLKMRLNKLEVPSLSDLVINCKIVNSPEIAPWRRNLHGM